MSNRDRVFFSYAREDRETVADIVTALKDEGVSVYWDRQIGYGANWLQDINAALEAAPCVIVAWSRHSIGSTFVQAEAMRGFDRQALAPVLIEAGVKAPTPFGVLQNADFSSGIDRQSDDWRRFVDSIKAMIAKAARDGVANSSAPLGETVGAARASHQDKVAALANPLRAIADDPDVAQPDVAASIDAIMSRLSRDDLFTIAVVGRMKVGKSTLLNALLGPAEGVAQEPLPAEDNPCTATLIKLRFADTPHCRPYLWDQDANAIGAAMNDWSFSDFHKRARIYVHGEESNVFDTIAEFEVGWPSRLLRSGVTLMDTPGISENRGRTALTRQALGQVDAAIIAYRSEPLAGTDEIEFADEVTERAGKTFTLINMRGADHKMPPDPSLEKVVRKRLNLDPQRTLGEQDVYFAHFRDGLRASYKRDGALAAQSGMAEFERRLASFLIGERYLAHVLKALRELAPMAKSLSQTVDTLIAGASADVGKLRETVAACRADLQQIERKKAAIETLVANSRKAVEAAALRSYQAKIGAIASAMPAKLEGMSLGIDGFLDKLAAGTVQNSKWVNKTAERINGAVRSELEQWAEAESDEPGLARDLEPAMSTMVEGIRAQADDIGRILKSMHSKISALSPNLSGDGKIVGEVEMAASLVSGVLLFGPLGVVGLGGWRGVAGAVGGTVAAGFGMALVGGLLHLFPPTLIASLILGAAALLGGIFGSTADIEKRLKAKAWQAIEPKLRDMAHDPAAEEKLNSAIVQWFDEIRRRMSDGLAQIVAIEQSNLARLEQLSRDSDDKARLIARLTSHQAAIAGVTGEISSMDRDVDAAMKTAGGG